MSEALAGWYYRKNLELQRFNRRLRTMQKEHVAGGVPAPTRCK